MRAGKLQLLLVDDHAAVRAALRDWLSMYPDVTVVAEAANGMEAIDLVDKSHPDIVVMDINMPRMDGIQATQAIKRTWPRTIIIGLSVLYEEGQRQKLLEAGASAVVDKAAEPNAVYATIKDAAARGLFGNRHSGGC